MTSVYDSRRLAAGYAFDRPPVHAQILESARLAGRARRALDIGCGAGVSTAALAPLTERAVGLEPVAAMLIHRRRVAPWAEFVTGVAERLPFRAASFDLVAAAGSLNYADVPAALGEVARVLTGDGTFLLYDFSSARESLAGEAPAGEAPAGDALAAWFDSFERRFPFPPGWRPLAVPDLPLRRSGLRLVEHSDVEVRLPMTRDAYLRYVLSEVNVDSAVAGGAHTEEQAIDWCRQTLAPVFADGELTVIFRGYLAALAHG